MSALDHKRTCTDQDQRGLTSHGGHRVNHDRQHDVPALVAPRYLLPFYLWWWSRAASVDMCATAVSYFGSRRR